MKRSKTEPRLFVVIETSKKTHEQYHLYMTEAEIKAWCKTKNEAYGYIEGVGGDKSYTCFAYYAEY